MKFTASLGSVAVALLHVTNAISLDHAVSLDQKHGPANSTVSWEGYYWCGSATIYPNSTVVADVGVKGHGIYGPSNGQYSLYGSAYNDGNITVVDDNTLRGESSYNGGGWFYHSHVTIMRPSGNHTDELFISYHRAYSGGEVWSQLHCHKGNWDDNVPAC